MTECTKLFLDFGSLFTGSCWFVESYFPQDKIHVNSCVYLECENLVHIKEDESGGTSEGRTIRSVHQLHITCLECYAAKYEKSNSNSEWII